jgi:hypothetical protein
MKDHNLHITQEQAIFFKEKRFNLKVSRFLDLTSGIEIKDAPLGNYNLTKHSVSIPDQGQVLEWLRVMCNIFIRVDINTPDNYYYEILFVDKARFGQGILSESFNYASPSEAYSAAFDRIKKDLI